MSHNRIKIKLILQGRTMAQTIRKRFMELVIMGEGSSASRSNKSTTWKLRMEKAASRWFRNRSNGAIISVTNKAALLTLMIEIIATTRLIKIPDTRQWAMIWTIWVAHHPTTLKHIFLCFEINSGCTCKRMIGCEWRVLLTRLWTC